MIRITSESELRAAFRESDQPQVQISSDFKFPLGLKDYLAWTEPSGHRVYLVFQDVHSGHPMGVVFERTRGAAHASPSMCQWCHSVRPGTAVGLLTTDAGPNRRIGIHLCADLDCKEQARKAPSANDFNEGLNASDKVGRILARMNDFAKHNLF